MNPYPDPRANTSVTECRAHQMRRGIAAWDLAGAVKLLTLSGITGPTASSDHHDSAPIATPLGRCSWCKVVRCRPNAELAMMNQRAKDAGLLTHFTYPQDIPTSHRNGTRQSAHSENPEVGSGQLMVITIAPNSR